MQNESTERRSGDERRTTFATGSVRCEKVAGEKSKFPLRYDLLLANTVAMRRLAETYGEGSGKYGDDNWRKGIPEKSTINHSIAHLIEHLEGDKSEDHIAHAAWGLITLMWTQQNRPELLDLSEIVQRDPSILKKLKEVNALIEAALTQSTQPA